MKAFKIATKAHEGQKDKAGQPYILHPLYIASQMETPEEFMTALLHDVVEDTEYTPEDLLHEGIPEIVVEAVVRLTHEKGTPYLEYVDSLRENEIARTVKNADLKHNADLRRLPFVTDEDLKRNEKYKKAIEIIKEEAKL